MPSAAHQWLVLWVARKMVFDGFQLRGFEGPAPRGGRWNVLPGPFEIAGARPDVWGIRAGSGEVAVGEAKTSDDLARVHTLAQLQAFGRLIQRRRGAVCRLYLGVPRSAAGILDRVLERLGLAGAPHVFRLHVPDCFLSDDGHEYT